MIPVASRQQNDLHKINDRMNTMLGKNSLNEYLDSFLLDETLQAEARIEAMDTVIEAFQNNDEKLYRADLPCNALTIRILELKRAHA